MRESVLKPEDIRLLRMSHALALYVGRGVCSGSVRGFEVCMHAFAIQMLPRRQRNGSRLIARNAHTAVISQLGMTHVNGLVSSVRFETHVWYSPGLQWTQTSSNEDVI